MGLASLVTLVILIIVDLSIVEVGMISPTWIIGVGVWIISRLVIVPPNGIGLMMVFLECGTNGHLHKQIGNSRKVAIPN